MPKPSDLVVLVPVLNRPHRVIPVMESVRAATPGASVLFIANSDDDPELAALEAAGAEFITVDNGYAHKINEGVRQTTEPLIFIGADDLHWRPGWFEQACRRLDTGDEGVAARRYPVIGVNDLCSQRVKDGHHATHFLVTREYAMLPTIDGGRGPWPENYFHWYGDDEFVGTAKYRDALYIDTDAIVEHHHYLNEKAPADDTYMRAREMASDDKRIFLRRRDKWKRR